MKKLPVVLCACLAITGCTNFDPDLDRAANHRAAERNAYHQEFGCHFAGDHDSYRNCLLSTYSSEKPKTFTPSKDDKGRALAIIKDETKQSYDKDTDTYKTERVIVIETEEQLVPVPTPVVVAETQNVVTETLEEPCPEEEEVLPVAEPLPVVQELQVVEVPVEPKKDTWWETYKKNKSVKPAEVQCPCPDPNEPCPQCVDK